MIFQNRQIGRNNSFASELEEIGRICNLNGNDLRYFEVTDIDDQINQTREISSALGSMFEDTPGKLGQVVITNRSSYTIRSFLAVTDLRESEGRLEIQTCDLSIDTLGFDPDWWPDPFNKVIFDKNGRLIEMQNSSFYPIGIALLETLHAPDALVNFSFGRKFETWSLELAKEYLYQLRYGVEVDYQALREEFDYKGK